MLKIFQKVPVYVKIYRNKIEITDINTQVTISKTSSIDFSTNRLLVADFNIVEMLIREILIELGLSRRALKVLIQQAVELEGGLSEIEKRALRDLAEQSGGAVIYIVNRTKIMTIEEIQDFLNLNARGFKFKENKENPYSFIIL